MTVPVRSESPLVLDAVPAARAAVRRNDWIELTKPRITALVVLTTLVGFQLGAVGDYGWAYVTNLLIGTALVCGGTSALNQWWERARDARMERTRDRPLAAGRVTPDHGLAFAIGLSVIGLFQLAFFVNLLSALVTAATLVLYVFAYTPLKTRTWLCTLVGAIPGALPPVIGWTAARGTLDAGAWSLFAIMFVWQLPHFYAIAWMYRDDYERGGFPMLPVVDKSGRATTRHIVVWSLTLVPVSVVPVILGLSGSWYAAGAVMLGLAFVALAAALAVYGTLPHAKRVFLGSIVYLPALFVLLVLDKTPLF